jgi:hypothetical protein
MSTCAQIDASVCGEHLNCPRCGLSIEVRPYRTAIRHCPRCVARNRVIVELFFSSALPADVRYDESLLSQAQRLALVIKTSDGHLAPAIDERAALPPSAATTGHLPALSPAGRAGSRLQRSASSA